MGLSSQDKPNCPLFLIQQSQLLWLLIFHNVMVIILKNITETTKHQDIASFIEPEVKGGIFAPKGRIISVSILTYKDIKKNGNLYHGLIEITPDPVAERVITKLNEKILNGKQTEITRYHFRNSNDRRRNDSLRASRRDFSINDRRNPFLVKVKADFLVSSGVTLTYKF